MNNLCSTLGHLWTYQTRWVDSAKCVKIKRCMRCPEEHILPKPGWSHDQANIDAQLRDLLEQNE